MSSPTPQVWLADAMRVLAAFPAEDRRTLLEMLGTEQREPGPSPATPPEPAEEPARAPEPPPPASLPRLDMLKPTRHTAARPVTTDGGVGVPPLPIPLAPIAHRPLLDRGDARRVLRAAFARPRPTHHLDVPRIVDLIARVRSLNPLPVEQRARLVAGSELLVDIGAGMQPFDADADDLTRVARRLIGDGRLRVARFRQVPTRAAGAGTGPAWTWAAYRMPPRRVPVVLLTDLGVAAPLPAGVPAAVFEWAELFDQFVRRDIVPVALTPYRASRVPAELHRRSLILRWDGAGSSRSIAGMVRARLRRLR